MLKDYIALPKPKLGDALKRFSTALNAGRFSIRRELSLIFLCGANQSDLVPSARRQYLKKTIEAALPHARIVYAELVMEELAKHGKVKNLLDIEHKISNIADWILIVLESYSSFCELGAFAHQGLRKKLLVVNDSKFRAQPSFINHGPLQAIKEDVAEDRIIWYPMGATGIQELDAIGLTVPGILKHLSPLRKRTSLDRDALLPSAGNQASLFFLHDIIYLCGPITHQETIEIYKSIFGSQPFEDVKSLRGILHASKLITPIANAGESSYISTATETFISFGGSADSLISAFRRFHLKHNPGRLVHA
ncbi:retron St85 family effector protein [Ralstonia nicotianae]|uniref:retron St85 family effector protein n=1 Tax=Ralstonia nicotianae TaxID=3037696 RepID=UPI001BA7F88F|nr:retron St85 family effector protein [Ralstonia nicotianae]